MINLKDVRESVENNIIGIPRDDKRRELEDRKYFYYLDFIFSRKFRKLLMNSKRIFLLLFLKKKINFK